MPTPTDYPEIAVSIVVPMRNAELHLRECLDSLVGQSLPNIEILCFDDASTDSTAAIAEEYAARDQRLRLTTYAENRSSSQARKDGALAARGKYLMFVDADDYLDLNACRVLAARMDELGIDVLQFGTNILNVDGADPARIASLERFLTPLEQPLVGSEPFTSCFVTGGYGHTLWNKIYRTDLAKEAFHHVPDGSFPKAQDTLAYFVLAWHARSYRGVADRFYNYRFGSGITGAAEMSLERLAIYSQQVLVADAVDRFVAQNGGTPDQLEAARRLRQNLVSDCVQQWFRRTPRSVASPGFDVLASAWPMEDLAGAMHRKLHDQRRAIASRLTGAHSLSPKTDHIPPGGTLGVFYHRLSIGGVQRVLSTLIPMYLEMGYRVVMLLEEEHPGAEFELPAEVSRVVLPKPEQDYQPRGQRLRQVIRDAGLDAVVYCAGSNPTLLYDLLVTKAEGLPFIVSIHDSAFHSLLNNSLEIAARPAMVRLADIAQVLSEAEEVYWRSQGVNAMFVPNPATTEIVDEADLDPQPGNLLWVGRLDLWVKRCLDAVRVMAVVVRSCPTARLHMVGQEWQPGISDEIRREIHRLGMEDHVILCGSSNEVEKYYRRAEVVLITSVTESSSMAVVEAKAFGIPIAMYSLPHLPTLSDGKGFVSVPQGDVEELAQAIVSLLKNDELRRRLGREGRESLAKFKSLSIESQWRELFARAVTPGTVDARPADDRPVAIGAVGALISNALDIHVLGVKRRQEENRDLRRQLAKLQSEAQGGMLGSGTGGGQSGGWKARRRRRLVQLGLAAGLGAIGVGGLVSSILLENWQAAALLGVGLLGLAIAGAAYSYLILLRRATATERRLARALDESNTRLQRRIRDGSRSTAAALEAIRVNDQETSEDLKLLGRLVTELGRESAEATRDAVMELVASPLSDLAEEVSATTHTASELEWAATYADSIRGSQWYRNQAISPGRWAVGYPFLYVLYRVLDETGPTSILELGLGQTTKMISQYAQHHQPAVSHVVVEHDPKWMEVLDRSFEVPATSTVLQLDLAETVYGVDQNVTSYSGFAERLGNRKYDLVCIDGPFGGKAEHFARVDLLSILPDCLAEDFVILLDDHDRSGEQNTAKEIRRVLSANGITHHWHEYSGEKSMLAITSADLRFVTSM